MTPTTEERTRPDYGIDAPDVIRNLAIVGVACVVAGVAYAPARSAFFSPAISLLATAGLMLYSSKWGKLRFREKLMDAVPWRGDEQVLDAGCGSGLLLVAAAKRVPRGTATGVDIWRQQDLANNRPEKPLLNARREGVGDRVRVENGDIRQLPFEDGTFDVAVSLNVLHNISQREEREKALREIVRVLKPGGRVLLSDFRNTGEYAAYLRKMGLQDARRQFIAWVGIFPMYAASGTKEGCKS